MLGWLRTRLGQGAGLALSLPGLVISPAEEAALLPAGGFWFSLKEGGVCGRERFASELYIFSKGLVALVTAYSVDKNLCYKLKRPAVKTARCSEANRL